MNSELISALIGYIGNSRAFVILGTVFVAEEWEKWGLFLGGAEGLAGLE